MLQTGEQVTPDPDDPSPRIPLLSSHLAPPQIDLFQISAALTAKLPKITFADPVGRSTRDPSLTFPAKLVLSSRRYSDINGLQDTLGDFCYAEGEHSYL